MSDEIWVELFHRITPSIEQKMKSLFILQRDFAKHNHKKNNKNVKSVFFRRPETSFPSIPLRLFVPPFVHAPASQSPCPDPHTPTGENPPLVPRPAPTSVEARPEPAHGAWQPRWCLAGERLGEGFGGLSTTFSRQSRGRSGQSHIRINHPLPGMMNK